MNWINIEDRVPQLSEYLTGYLSSEPVIVSNGFSNYVAHLSVDKSSGVRSWICADGWRIDTVTHWMPLPILPDAHT